MKELKTNTSRYWYFQYTNIEYMRKTLNGLAIVCRLVSLFRFCKLLDRSFFRKIGKETGLYNNPCTLVTIARDFQESMQKLLESCKVSPNEKISTNLSPS